MTTFVLFGGCSAVTNFLPKIRRNEDKSAFLSAYLVVSAVAVGVFVVLINVFPGCTKVLIHKPLDTWVIPLFSLLTPVIVASQMVTFSLAGLMEFRLSSLLSQLQVVLICALATCGFFLFREWLTHHAMSMLAATVCVANAGVIGIGLWRVIPSVSGLSARLYLPEGFWRFSGFVHLNTISTFAYQRVDQLFVLAVLGTRELGAYFILWQCAQLVSFVPQRIGQVMLASFSHLVAVGDHDNLRRAYHKICRLTVILSTPLALLLILFSRPVAALFGEWYAQRHLYLLLLAAAIQIGVVGSVSSMLIMSKERTGLFLANSVVLIGLQLSITLTLLNKLGVYAVIVGRAVGIVSGQIGLFLIIRYRLKNVHLSPPVEYWGSLAVVLIAAITAWLLNPITLALAGEIFAALLCVFLILIRFQAKEIAVLFSRA
ncbi:MAG: lipopolysaccharide biosynthesis protein [Sedimentisphaerales bacterium]|nr:lipopolysaccharide biosynthesis protein [Sedimentisphaerales bacterium]